MEIMKNTNRSDDICLKQNFMGSSLGADGVTSTEPSRQIQEVTVGNATSVGWPTVSSGSLYPTSTTGLKVE